MFVFPARTLIEPHETVVVSDERTGLASTSPSSVRLEYPNGAFAAAYDEPLVVARFSEASPPPKASSISSPPQTTSLAKSSAPRPAADPSASSSREVATVFLSGAFGKSGLFEWLIALVIVIALAIAAVFRFDKGPKNEADTYEIEEIS
jgi:hypothetical protein